MMLAACGLVISFEVKVQAAANGNLLAYPGFEEIANGAPAGWGRYAPVGSPKGLQVSTEARTGKYAALIDVAASLADSDVKAARVAWYHQRIPGDADGQAERGAQYRFSAYYRTEGNLKGTLAVERRTLAGKLDNAYLDLSPTKEWRQATLVFTWPEAGDYGVHVGLYAWLATEGKIWFDDVELVKLDRDSVPDSIARLGVAPLDFDLSKATFDVPSLSELRGRIPSAHPRLFVRPESLNDLREKRKRSAMAQLTWQNIRGQAMGALHSVMPAEPPNARPGGVADITAWREGITIADDVLKRLHSLGFTYLMTEEETYGQAGKKLLLHVAAWDPYGTSGRALNDEISMRLLYGMSRAYDWLYPVLTEEERNVVRQSMRERGNDVYLTMRRSNFEDHLLNNHLVRSMGFLGEAAIAFLGEFPEAEIWFDYIVSLFVLRYPAFGGDEGGWSQGVSYWQHYISWVLEFLDAFKIATEVDLYQKPFFRNTGYFKLYAHPPKSKFGAFGDHCDSPPGQVAAQVVSWLATAFSDPALQWYASEISGMGRIPLLPTNSFIGYIKAFETPDALIAPALPDDLPQSRLFSDIGWALMNVEMRDWNNNVHVKFKSSPYGSHSHNHADQNSFIIEAYGSPLAISSGYYPWYGSPHHKTWTWESRSKNTILVDGQGQGVQSIEAKGDIVAASFGSQFDYVLGDATPSYQGRLQRFLRHLWFVKPNLIVIYDQLESGGTDTTYDWLLHTLDEMVVESEHNRVCVPAKTAEMWVSFVTPEQLSFDLTDQFTVPPEERDAHKPNQWHLTARANSQTGEGRFLTVLVPRPIAEAKEAPPVVRALPATNGHGVAVDLKNRSFTMAFRDDATAPLALEGFVAEATALATWKEGAQEGLMVIAGQRVEQDGKLRLSADQPVDLGATWQCVGETASLMLQIAAETSATIELALACQPETVMVNDRPIDTWTYEAGIVRVEIQESANSQL